MMFKVPSGPNHRAGSTISFVSSVTSATAVTGSAGSRDSPVQGSAEKAKAAADTPGPPPP